jgi:SAM-dependent methyltransferase
MYAHEQTLWWYVGMRAVSDALISRYVRRENDQPLEILDAGCGTGAGVEWLARYGRATGIDLSQDALTFCRKRDLSRLVRGSIEALPFADASFDLVTTFDVIYHRWVSDGTHALTEFQRVLRPGGHLLLRVPALPWLAGRHDEAVHTRQRYRRDEIVAALRQTGFAVERASYANMLLLPLVAAKRLAERWTADSPSDLDATPGWLNAGLTGALKIEARLVERTSLPLGVSVVAVARRP